MNYKVASTLEEVFEAWCIVYKQYLASSLINSNPYSIFTFPQYLSNKSAVILGQKMGMSVCTVSCVLDSKQGLPLDAYYKMELDKLRNQGKKLIEIGLLADMRKSHGVQNIVDLMSAIARFGVFSDHHDYVVGVHPRRVNFFRQIFGFDVLGEARSYESLKTAPVILLYANGQSMEVASKEAPKNVYADCDELSFLKRFMFNRSNSVSNLEFTNSVEHFFSGVWKKEEQELELMQA